VIAERIGRLAQPLRAALRVASVEGELFTAEVMARVRMTDEREMLGRLSRELDRRHGLVHIEAIERLGGQRVSRYRFRHYLCQKYLYDSLDKGERAYLHEDVGNVLEALYGDRANEISMRLARHFQEAGLIEKAIHYLHQAGERALQLSAYQETFAHLIRGLVLLMELPDTPKRAELELALQLSLGIAQVGLKGYGSDIKKTYTRARDLCQQMGKMTQLGRVVGELAVHYYVLAEFRRARDLAEEALSLAQQAADPLLVALGHWYLGFISFGLGEYTTARAHLEQVISFYEPQQHHAFVSLRGSDPGASALAYDACCLWCLGYPDQALERSQEALDLARELDHPFTLADVLYYGGCMVDAMRRDAEAVKDYSEELKRLASGLLGGWVSLAIRQRGEALAMLGNLEDGIAQMREGLTHKRGGVERCYQSGCLRSLAEAQARAGRPTEGLATLAEAFAFVEESGERHWEAEIYRLQGELLLAEGDEAEAEASLHQAIEVARRQQAKSWELRAVVSLGRLWQSQGKKAEAQQMLAETYGWFTEGFDTPDLIEAKILLEELS
jgi:tetratricopeptide (TPR) repeat protein